MATNLPATLQLSTPQVVLNGFIVPITPNSLKVRIPGDAKVRAISAGGGSVQTVSGVDAVNLLGKLDFKVPNTAANWDLIRALKRDLINGIGCTIQINDVRFNQAYQDMRFSKDTEADFKPDGDIPLEFEGTYVQ